MPDLDFLQTSSPVQITGDDELYAAKVTSLKELSTVDVVNNNGVNGALTVGTSSVEAKVEASRLSNRKSLFIYNNSSNTIFWGFSSGVTTSNGIPLKKGEFVSISVGDQLGVYLIAASSGNNVRIAESC